MMRIAVLSTMILLGLSVSYADGVRDLIDLSQDEWRRFMGGVLFIAGLGFLAYLGRRV